MFSLNSTILRLCILYVYVNHSLCTTELAHTTFECRFHTPPRDLDDYTNCNIGDNAMSTFTKSQILQIDTHFISKYSLNYPSTIRVRNVCRKKNDFKPAKINLDTWKNYSLFTSDILKAIWVLSVGHITY